MVIFMYRKPFAIFFITIFLFSCEKQEEEIVPETSNPIVETVDSFEKFPNKAYFEEPLPLLDAPTRMIENVTGMEIIENKKKNTTSILFLVAGETEEPVRVTGKEYNYLPSAEKNRFFKFSNGNKIGFLPIRDERVQISAWNEKWPVNEIFFLDLHSGIIMPLHIDYGFNIVILDSPERDVCWTILCHEGKDFLNRYDSTSSLLTKIEIPLQRERTEYAGYRIKIDYDGIFLLGGSIDWEDTFALSENKDELIYIETKVYDYSSHKN